MDNSIHKEPSPLAGKTVKLKPDVEHFQVADFGGSDFRVEDWWDRLGQGSWTINQGNAACIIYAMRAGWEKLPKDDEVLYGKIGSYGHLVHISEIEQEAPDANLHGNL